MKDTLQIIIPTNSLRDHEGVYDLSKDGRVITYKEIPYTYHASGLYREVYLSDCKKWVLKIPVSELYDGVMRKNDTLTLFAKHNILEAHSYENCPVIYKKYFAKTELVDYGWIIQEFVDVKPYSHSPSIRELGVKDNGQVCLFDFDPVIEFAMKEWIGSVGESLPTDLSEWYNYERVVSLLRELNYDGLEIKQKK